MRSMRVKILFVLAILASVVSGCATGPFNGLGNDEMAMLIIYRTDDQPLTKAQYDAVNRIAKKMGVRIDYQLSSPVEAGLTAGVTYGAAGALGGATQGFFYPGALSAAAAGYTGIVYGLGGVVNGMQTYSYSKVYAIAQATEIALRDEERDGAVEFRRIHVVAAFVRSQNQTGNPAPELRKRMPDWKGPVAGTPVQK